MALITDEISPPKSLDTAASNESKGQKEVIGSDIEKKNDRGAYHPPRVFTDHGNQATESTKPMSRGATSLNLVKQVSSDSEADDSNHILSDAKVQTGDSCKEGLTLCNYPESADVNSNNEDVRKKRKSKRKKKVKRKNKHKRDCLVVRSEDDSQSIDLENLSGNDVEVKIKLGWKKKVTGTEQKQVGREVVQMSGNGFESGDVDKTSSNNAGVARKLKKTDATKDKKVPCSSHARHAVVLLPGSRSSTNQGDRNIFTKKSSRRINIARKQHVLRSVAPWKISGRRCSFKRLAYLRNWKKSKLKRCMSKSVKDAERTMTQHYSKKMLWSPGYLGELRKCRKSLMLSSNFFYDQDGLCQSSHTSTKVILRKTSSEDDDKSRIVEDGRLTQCRQESPGSGSKFKSTPTNTGDTAVEELQHCRRDIDETSIIQHERQGERELIKNGGKCAKYTRSSLMNRLIIILFALTRMLSFEVYVPAKHMARMISLRHQRFLIRKAKIKQFIRLNMDGMLKQVQKKKMELMKHYFLFRHNVSAHLNRLFMEIQGKEKEIVKMASLLDHKVSSRVRQIKTKITKFSVVRGNRKTSSTEVYCCKHCGWVKSRCGFISDVGIVTECIVEKPQALLFAPPQGNSNRRSRKYMRDVEADGQVSDSSKDPPGQQSYYIPPGDTRKENYRLATFEHFPIESPISRKSLAKCGFYFTGFLDRVKCFACGRTVERWEAGDNPAQLRWHKEDCPFPRGRPCGNVAVASLFGRIMGIDRSMAVTAPSAGEEVLEQRDPVTGAVTRTVRYPSDLPERVRQTGGTFEIGPNNTINIQSGPGPTRSQGLAAPRSTPRAQVQPSQPRQWRMANVISADVRRFLTNLFLTRELDRLTSFARWPTARPNASPVALAKSGFFYLGDSDRTQCFSCGGVLRNWTAEDNPDTEHQRHFPQCLFLFGDDRRNVSIPLQPESRDEREQLYPCTFPTNPHMRSEATRLETFDSRWPMGRTAATPEQIAEAGFFFLGERDRVKCWYCNGGLQHWEYDDIPWVEHAKWFPNCQFLLRSKGQLYVYRYLAIHPHLARPIIARQAGARVDPGAGQDVPPPEDIPANAVNVRQPTPPPMIIDPQEDLRKRLEQVDRVMRTSDTVKTVLTMGFNEATVRAVLREKVESSAEENLDNAYSSVADLLDDVMAKDEEIKQEEQNRSNTASASSAGASMAAQPSVSGHGSGSFKTAPGSGKYNTSYINEDEEEDERNLYGVEPMEASSSANSLTVAKETGGSKSLQEALNAIQEEKLCKICYSSPADVIFLPCSHMICCMDCTQALRQCPICRARIEKAIKTYTS